MEILVLIGLIGALAIYFYESHQHNKTKDELELTAKRLHRLSQAVESVVKKDRE